MKSNFPSFTNNENLTKNNPLGYHLFSGFFIPSRISLPLATRKSHTSHVHPQFAAQG